MLARDVLNCANQKIFPEQLAKLHDASAVSAFCLLDGAATKNTNLRHLLLTSACGTVKAELRSFRLGLGMPLHILPVLLFVMPLLLFPSVLNGTLSEVLVTHSVVLVRGALDVAD